jgi:hypothetical protein
VENKVQIIIEVDQKNSSAEVKAVSGSIEDLRSKVDALTKEYSQNTSAAGKASKAKKDLSDNTDKATGGMKRLRAQASDLTKIVSGLAAAWGAWKLAGFIKDSALLAPRVETLGVVMEVVGRNAGYSATEMNKYEESVKSMGITSTAAHEAVIKMTQAQLDLTKASDLARISQDAAVIGVMNSSQAFETILHGITTLQPEVLRTVGIIVNFEQEYSKFAAANDRTIASLSGAEKQQIAMNAVFEAGTRIAGTYEAAMETAGKKITSLDRYIEELKESIGIAFGPATSSIIDSIGDAIKIFGEEIEKESTQQALAEIARLVGELATIATDNLPGGLQVAVGALKIFTSGIFTVYGALEMTGISIAKWSAMAADLLTGNFSQAMETWQAGREDMAKSFDDMVTRVDNLWNKSAATSKKSTEAAKEEADAVKESFKERREAAKKAAEAEAEALEQAKQLRKQDEKSLSEWLETKERIGKSATEIELAELQKQKDAYARIVEDKVDLEQWWADEKSKIEAQAADDTAALYEELYKATGKAAYADAAIENMQRVLDAQEAAWAQILDSDDDAHMLRVIREEEYVQSVYDSLDMVIDAEESAANKRIEIANDLADRRIAEEERAGRQIADADRNSSSAAGPEVSGFTIYHYGGRNYGSLAAVEAAIEAVKKAAADASEQTITRIKSEAALAEAREKSEEARVNAEEKYQNALERQADAIDRVNDAQKDYIDELKSLDFSDVKGVNRIGSLSGVMGSIYSAMDTIGLGSLSSKTQLNTLSQLFFGGLNDLGLLDSENLLDYLNTMISLTADSYADEISAREAAINALKTETEFRQNMILSESLAPSLSYESYQNVYADLYAGATTAEGYKEFLSFLEGEYLPFMRTYYDGNEAYLNIWDNIFGSGGVLDSLAGDMTGAEGRSIEDIQGEALDELLSIVNIMDSGGSLFSMLDDNAKAQLGYSQSFLDTLKEQLGYSQSFLDTLSGQSSNIESTAANTLGTEVNTALLKNLISFVGSADVYEVGGAYYNAEQVELLASKAANVGGGFRLTLGGETYTSIDQLGGRKTVYPTDENNDNIYEYTSPINNPVAETYVGSVNIGGKWYTSDYVQSMIDSSNYGRTTIGGTVYTDTELSNLLSGQTWQPSTYNFASSGASAWTPSMPEFIKKWSTSGMVAPDVDMQGNPLMGYYPMPNTFTIQPLSVSGGYWDNAWVEYSGNFPDWYTKSKIGETVKIPDLSSDQVIEITATPWGSIGSEKFSGVPVTGIITIADKESIWDEGKKGTPGLRYDFYREGGLAKAPAIAGEYGEEWIVPTYEPERSRFLGSAPASFWNNINGGSGAPAIDYDAIGRSVARALMAGKEGREPVHIHLHIDGREIANVTADQLDNGNDRLLTAIQRRLN